MTIQMFGSDFLRLVMMSSSVPEELLKKLGTDPEYLVRICPDGNHTRMEIGYGSDAWELGPDINCAAAPRVSTPLS